MDTEVKAPKKTEPSPWEAYKEFLELVSFAQDKTTSMVTIDIAFYSPGLAKEWLTWLIQDINEFMREQDKVEAQASIDYLTHQLGNIKVAPWKQFFIS